MKVVRPRPKLAPSAYIPPLRTSYVRTPYLSPYCPKHVPYPPPPFLPPIPHPCPSRAPYNLPPLSQTCPLSPIPFIPYPRPFPSIPTYPLSSSTLSSPIPSIPDPRPPPVPDLSSSTRPSPVPSLPSPIYPLSRPTPTPSTRYPCPPPVPDISPVPIHPSIPSLVHHLSLPILHALHRPARCVVTAYTRDADVMETNEGGTGALTMVSVRDHGKLK